MTADTNLLLLSDGSPVCANCSYCCNVCGQPILDEAIMTGDDSYHAHCFNCKVCKKRIEELVFAKTSQGIYCMPCHSERVARSRRHLERKERERREREKQMVGLTQAMSKDTPVSINSAMYRSHDTVANDMIPRYLRRPLTMHPRVRPRQLLRPLRDRVLLAPPSSDLL